jgi:hypothetical protein
MGWLGISVGTVLTIEAGTGWGFRLAYSLLSRPKPNPIAITPKHPSAQGNQSG